MIKGFQGIPQIMQPICCLSEVEVPVAEDVMRFDGGVSVAEMGLARKSPS